MNHYPDRSTMVAPGICFVCEQTPSDGQGYVDTLSTFIPGFPSHMTGPKYVCDQCVGQLAEAVGLYTSADVGGAEASAATAEGKFQYVVDYVSQKIQELSSTVLAEVAAQAPVVVAAQDSVQTPVQAAEPTPKAKAKPKAKAEDSAAGASDAAVETA